MSTEYDKLVEALKNAKTPEQIKAAADAMRAYVASQGGHSSRPTLVSLGLGDKYPTSVPVENIADEMEKNPNFFQLIKRAVTGK